MTCLYVILQTEKTITMQNLLFISPLQRIKMLFWISASAKLSTSAKICIMKMAMPPPLTIISHLRVLRNLKYGDGKYSGMQVFAINGIKTDGNLE